MEIKKPEYHPDVRPERPKHTHKPRPNPEFRARFAELQRRILASPKTREPSPDDVESFEDSYRKCGLNTRWGPLTKRHS